MIFNTMQKHAKSLIEAGMAGTDCLILERVGIDFGEMDKAWKSAATNRSATKLIVPVILFGRKQRTSISRFYGSGKANASKQTYQKKSAEWDRFRQKYEKGEVGDSDSPLPFEWFPWLSNGNCMEYSDWRSLLERVRDASDEKVCSLFSQGKNDDGRLFTFHPDDANFLNYVRKAVCLPCSAKAPGVLVHAILAYNALYVSEFGKVIGIEALRFCLLLWILELAGEAPLVSMPGSGRHLQISPQMNGGGSIGDINPLTLLINTGTGPDSVIGQARNVPFAGNDSVYGQFLHLTREEDVETISLGGKAYTAPATGKSPTNAYQIVRLSGKRENALSADVRFGFEREEVFPLVDGFECLVKDTKFKFSMKSRPLPDRIIVKDTKDKSSNRKLLNYYVPNP